MVDSQPQNTKQLTHLLAALSRSMTWSMVQHTPISAKLRPARVAHTAYCGHTAGVPRAYYGHTAGTLRANWGILGQTAGASRAKSYSSLKAILIILNPSEADSCWEDEMFKGNEPSDDEGNGRWDPMLLEKELNQKSLMNRLRLDEERSKGKMVDKEGEDERQKGKRAAELEMGSEKA
ncbi:hypothetical protein AXX17_AT5G29800 [Arabidopsis thaliana]|uniref:Uncharacterized protein n=1 Tax=Arabidopsis thaliana TaxID=3702 RepID=A0A178USL5_ARATH|nr:hypothetical protein AXX17_AT5G29800 [Arabidopsis thaliana]